MKEEKEFFWKDLSGRGYNGTYNTEELIAALKTECDYYETCEECNGAGEKEKTLHVGEEGMQIEMDAPVVCGFCDGTGKVLGDNSISEWAASAEVGDEYTNDTPNFVIRIK
jgi:DnaJ-class molecular chaperone